MKVTIKKFSVKMEVKTNGIELGVHSPDGKQHLGDLVVTKTRLIWCKGQTKPENGQAIHWEDLINKIENEGW